MKKGCFSIFIILFFLYTIVSLFTMPDLGEGYYLATKNTTIYNNDNTSGRQLGTLPKDSLIEVTLVIDGFAKFVYNGYKAYVQVDDLELKEKNDTIQTYRNLILYFIAGIIILYLLYSFLKDYKLTTWSQLKLILYPLAFVGLFLLIIKNSKSIVKLPTMVQTHSAVAVTLNNGDIVPAGTPITILCYTNKYDPIALDTLNKRQFTAPLNIMPRGTDKSNKQELSTYFRYNVSATDLASYIGKDISDFTQKYGDYINGYGNVYEFPYLNVVYDNHREEGLRLHTNDGIIQEVDKTYGKSSSNIFCLLPFYQEIASWNLFSYSPRFSEESFILHILNIAFALFVYWLAVFLLVRSISSIYLWKSDNSRSYSEKILTRYLFILIVPIIYIGLISILDMTHSYWLIMLPIAISIPVSALFIAIEGGYSAIYKCPSCNTPGKYNPVKHIIRREIQGPININYQGIEYAFSISSFVATKEFTRRVYFTKDGACSKCGFVDHTTYFEDIRETATVNCPFCNKHLITKCIVLNQNTYRNIKDLKKEIDIRTIPKSQEIASGNSVDGEVTTEQRITDTTTTTVEYSESCPNCSYHMPPQLYTFTVKSVSHNTKTQYEENNTLQ